MDTDFGPVDDLDASRSNDVDAPYTPGVVLLYDDTDLVATLTLTRARRLAYRILAAVEGAQIEQADKLRYDQLVAAGVIPHPKPNLTAVPTG